MFRTTTIYKLKITDWIGVAFPGSLPSNAFIDKGRCAIGGTTKETKDKSRISILSVSNVSILIDKFNAEDPEERPDHIIYGKIKQRQVDTIIANIKHGEKIMTTPEGIVKIMKAALKCGRIQEVYNEWFLLLDECHTFITEDYRPDILAPFDYFWNFKHKSIISATPFYFSDQRFYTELDLHKITFTEVLNTVTLINALSVEATLNFILTNVDHFPGNLHIFYNSVTAIRNSILRAGLTDCNIFCGDSDDNFLTLGDNRKLYCEQPLESNYKKVNFYTSKYFEGWDLKDENSTVLLVTDYRKSHTAIGINNKAKQAIGRPRKKIHRLIHITNHQCSNKRKTLDDYRGEFKSDAMELIENYNKFIASNRTKKFQDDHRLKYFANIDEHTKLATLNSNKLDQQVNQAAVQESYKHIKFIIEDWQSAYYDVIVKQYRLKLESKTTENRKSLASKLKEDYQILKDYYATEEAIFTLGKTTAERIEEQNPIAFNAYHQLSLEFLEKVKYNIKKVEKGLIIKSNELADIKLSKYLKRTFEKGKFYPNYTIQGTLQGIYQKLGIIDPKTGNIKIASPIQVGETGLFDVRKTKRLLSDGKIHNGLLILDYKLGLKVTD